MKKMPAYWVLRVIAKTEFRSFTQTEWMGWSGCESADPQYGEFKAEDPFTGLRVEGTIILDGDNVEVNCGYVSAEPDCGEPAIYKFTAMN